MLIVERDAKQSLVYYTNKVLHAIELRYQKVEKLTYVIVLALRKLTHYFEAHSIII